MQKQKLSNNAQLNLYCSSGYNSNCQRKPKLWAKLPLQCNCSKWVKANAPIYAVGYSGGNWVVGPTCPKCIVTRNTYP